MVESSGQSTSTYTSALWAMPSGTRQLCAPPRYPTTPGDRWVSGIGLVGAVLAVGGYGYDRFRRSKAHSGR